MLQSVQHSSVSALPSNSLHGAPNKKAATDDAALHYDGPAATSVPHRDALSAALRAPAPRAKRNSVPSVKTVVGAALTLGLAQLTGAAPLTQRAAPEFPSANLGGSFAPLTYFVYNGGPLIQNVKVSTVYWNTNVAYMNELDAFYGEVTQSPWFDIAAQYSTADKPIGRGSFEQRITLNNSSRFVDDTDILGVIGSMVSAGQVLRNTDGNSLLSFHFPPDTFITQKTLLSCRDFMAYHGTAVVDGLMYPYAVVADQGGLCQKQTQFFRPNSTYDQLGRTTTAASHELMEAATDPAAGLVVRANRTQIIGPPLGWVDVVSEGEVADICEGQTAMSGRWVVQKIWSNTDQACIASPGSANGTNA